MEVETEVEDSSLKEDMLLEEFQTLQEAFHGCHEGLMTGHLHYVVPLKEERKEHLEQEMIKVAEYINNQNQTPDKLKEPIKSMSSHLNYYKNKARQEKLDQSSQCSNCFYSNDLINSKQRYMLLAPKNKSAALAKADFYPNFANRIALQGIINQNKKWLRTNIFKPAEIWKLQHTKAPESDLEADYCVHQHASKE